MRTAKSNIIPVLKRWDIYAHCADGHKHIYSTDCFDDIKKEHKDAVRLLMAARTEQLDKYKTEEHVFIPGIGMATFFVDMQPIIVLYES